MCSQCGPASPRQSVVPLRAIDNHHRDDKSLTPTSAYRGNSRAHVYCSEIDHTMAYPGCGASKKRMAGPIQLDKPRATTMERRYRKHKRVHDFDDTIATSALFRAEKTLTTYAKRGFPIGGKFVCFHYLRIEFISIHKKRIFSMRKCPSLILGCKGN